MTKQNGFTLVEILVVVAIVAIIGTLSAVAVNSARSKQRDATRLSNIRQMQSALEDYFNENNTYPSGELLPLGDALVSSCLSITGFHGDCSGQNAVITRFVSSQIESGLDDVVTCGDPRRNAFCYSQASDGAGYVIYFELENGLERVGLQGGLNCAMPDGMSASCAQ
jgi:prepilin-type N-terminal cleavage/methylation domain-containing protein